MRKLLYSLFIPHPSNNHRAKILHHRSLLVLIAFFAFCSFFFNSSFNPFSGKIQTFADISLKELLDYTNQNRLGSGLPKLSDNSELDKAAKAKADNMFQEDYWAHNSPDGKTPWYFITSAGYNYVYAGENLARGFSSAKEVVDAWMASPDHRANILSPNYRDAGFAVEHGNLSGEETFLVVQEFGSKSIIPASTPIVDRGVQRVLGFSVNPKVANLAALSMSSKVALSLILVLLATFITDIFVVRRKNIARVIGHSLDHFMFMSTIALIVLILGLGQII